MREEYQDIIDRYLRGEMTPQETEDFEKKASADAELREQLEFTRLAVSAIGSRESKMRKIKQWESEDKGKMRYWISGIAAAMVILIAGGTYSILMRNNQVQEPVRGNENVFAIDTAKATDITENQDSAYINEDYDHVKTGTVNNSNQTTEIQKEAGRVLYETESLITFTPELIHVESPIPDRVKIDTLLRYPYWEKNTLEGFPFPYKVGAPPKDDTASYKLHPKMQEEYKIEEFN